MGFRLATNSAVSLGLAGIFNAALAVALSRIEVAGLRFVGLSFDEIAGSGPRSLPLVCLAMLPKRLLPSSAPGHRRWISRPKSFRSTCRAYSRPEWLSAATAIAEPPAFGPSGWKGGTPDAGVRKVWPQSVCWRHGKSRGLGLSFAKAQDWSQYSALRIFFTDARKLDAAFSDKGDGVTLKDSGKP